MSQWGTLLGKELLEMWRNYKWIWVPLTFIVLGIQEPIASYYLPQIIESVGGLPEGAKIEIPPPSAGEVLIGTLGQYNMIGLLIVVLITMGLVSGERKSGTAAMILVKPVSYASFITAKWAGAILLVWVSLFIGMVASWYYTGILFDWIGFREFLGSFLLEGLWLTFVLTVSLFFSSLFFVPGAAGFAAMATAVILSLVSGSLSHIVEWSPAMLADYAGGFILEGSFPEHSVMAVILSLAISAALLAAAIAVFRKKELAA